MIRDEIATFQELWNGHKIRTQKNRLHVISGIPMDLYNTDKVRNWGVTFEDDDPCGQLVRTMLDPLDAIDIDEFLLPETQAWCDQQLETLGFNGQIPEGELYRPHLGFYLELRQRVREHILGQQEPQLGLTPIPRGGIEDYVRNSLPSLYEI
jgi:hypothetical protein